MQCESEFIPNGVVSSKAPFIAKVLDKDRWSKAEGRAAEILANIQPSPTSEAHRNAVLSYLRCLIMTCVPCQVFTFGSVPLKTYLPDGDIDLTVFGDNQYPEDRLIKDVLYILQSEEKNQRAQFHVKEVHFILAEVKIIKCLVEKFVVDISFSQIGGLGTLCFLEEINYLINQNHLFKRSIILVKAWCYYESRIMGSHHGLISTYALEILVIYVFHVHSNTFAGPLEVLFRFLDFFNIFDWNNYCISLRGPVPITSLPNMRAEPPRKNCQQLLLSKKFLNACESCYGIIPTSQELREKPFVSKYINIVDPLRANNNLGRSITKGNFCRIKSAIAFGAKRIERLLNCPDDNLMAAVDLFFRNTWERNGNGFWIDARSYNFNTRNNYVINHESAETSRRLQGDEHTNTMNNALANRSMHHYQNNHQSLGQNLCDWIDEYAFDPNNASSDYYFEYGSGVNDENALHVNEAMLMHGQEHHDASIFNEYLIASMNLDSSAVSLPPQHVLAPGYMHENSFGVFHENDPSFESISGHNLPYSYSYGTGPFHAEWFRSMRSEFYEPELTEPVDYNTGSSFGNSAWKSGATSHTPKDYVVTADQKRLTREKHSGNPLDNRIRNKNVNSRASSSSRTTLPPTSRTNLSSSSFTTGSSSETNQPHATCAEAITSHVQAGKLPITVPNSSVPGSSQRAIDNQSLLPVSDGSSGSSFQVPTMFQYYNLPTQTGTSFSTTNDVNMHAESSVWNSIQHVNQINHDAAATDILEGDVETYLVNLQYGRFCKNPQPERPLPNNPPIKRLPLRRQFPWYRKPSPACVMNSMGHVHTPLPVMPSQHALLLHGGTNESAAFWLPRFSDGTGTYMPNPSSYHEQRYYRRKRHHKFRHLKNQKYEKKQEQIEMPGSNESSHRGESSRSGTSEEANSGSDSKSSSAHQPSS